MTNSNFGIIAEFKDPTELMKAAKSVRDSGYKNFDVYTPFPVHGMDDAMGLPASKLPWLVLMSGFFGCSVGLALQIWVSAVEYPLIISNKPFLSIPAFIPVTFELTILFSAFATVFGMFALNKLPMFNHPVFNASNIKKVTDDGFFLCVFCSDSKFNTDEVEKLLTKLNGSNIEKVAHD